jgi:predicted TIM-barrel fold metal-dependent hydrolase
MSTVTLERPTSQTAVRDGIVDSDIHPSPPRGAASLKRYLASQWQEHMSVYGDPHNGPYATVYGFPRYMPGTARRDAWPEGGGQPGSDLALMRTQHLDRNNVALGILEPLGFGSTARNLDYAAAMCSAINMWQVEDFVEPEPRLRASIVVPIEDTQRAVEELQRRAPDRSYAQIELPSLTLEPLGRRRYWPVYELAASYGLPIGIHVGGPTGARTAGGWPSYYNEEHLSLVATMQTHVTSLILEGVCEHFPDLKFVMIEGGIAWSISLRRRLDRLWRIMGNETPHVKRPPSEYMLRNFYFSTQPVEEPEKTGDLVGIFDQVGWERILYASDYPHWDYDDPVYAFKGDISDDRRNRLMRDNALGLYRLPHALSGGSAGDASEP